MRLSSLHQHRVFQFVPLTVWSKWRFYSSLRSFLPFSHLRSCSFTGKSAALMEVTAAAVWGVCAESSDNSLCNAINHFRAGRFCDSAWLLLRPPFSDGLSHGFLFEEIWFLWVFPNPLSFLSRFYWVYTEWEEQRLHVQVDGGAGSDQYEAEFLCVSCQSHWIDWRGFFQIPSVMCIVCKCEKN